MPIRALERALVLELHAWAEEGRCSSKLLRYRWLVCFWLSLWPQILIVETVECLLTNDDNL